MFCLTVIWIALNTGCAEKISVDNEAPVIEIEFSDLEFRKDGLWYQKGQMKPFSGIAVRYHENGARSWATELAEGVPCGRIREWDEDGNEIWP